MSWIEDRAFEDDAFRCNGREVWRNLKLAVAATVDSFNKIYTKRAEFQVSDCLHINENCFRVRSIPAPGEKERVIEFRLTPEKHSVEITRNNAGTLSPQRLTIATGKHLLQLHHDGKEISEDEASRLILEDLLFPGGTRREAITPPEREFPVKFV